ncbi:MAG: hypothetical protein R2706_07400 [Acidimicrobiales bacterium]
MRRRRLFRFGAPQPERAGVAYTGAGRPRATDTRVPFADSSKVAQDKVGGIIELVVPLVLTVAFLTRRPQDLNYFWRGVFALSVFGCSSR